MPLRLSELLCRACLLEDELMVDIYEEVEELQVDLCTLLERCGNIKVERTDTYPKYLCQECTRDLLNAAKFRKKCADTQLMLQELENKETAELANNVLQIEQPTEQQLAANAAEGLVADANELIVFDESEEVGYEVVTIKEECEVYTESNTHNETAATQSDTIVRPAKSANHLSSMQQFHSPHRFRCPHCGKCCQSNASLTLHLRVHSGERPFVCDICPKSFKTNPALSAHQRAHMQLAEHQCPHCDKNFTEASNLKRHITALHTNERCYTCNTCQRSFSRKFVLELHMRTHTGERPYACSRCDRRFAQLGVLRSHERTHTGLHLHRCGVCQKSFSRLKQLKQHERRHYTQEPFEQAALKQEDCSAMS